MREERKYEYSKACVFTISNILIYDFASAIYS